MRHLIFIGLILFAGYMAFDKYQNGDSPSVNINDFSFMESSNNPDVSRGFVTIYGHDNCPVTTRTIEALRKANIDYDYRDITNQSVKTSMIASMRHQNMKTRSINLPVVDIDGRFYIRPDMSTIKARL